MLPAEILPLNKKRDSGCELYKLQSIVDKTVCNSIQKRDEMTQRKRSCSFMIDDILGESRSKNAAAISNEPPNLPCSQCTTSMFDKERTLNINSEQHSSSFNYGPNRLVSSTMPVFVPSLNPASVTTRFGLYSPSVASSPPFSFGSRSSEVFTFLPGDFNENAHANFYNARHESLIHSPVYNPSVIVNLSNYAPKAATVRLPQATVVAMPSHKMECPGSRQLIWKPINRNPAKRKGGQIRFTNEQTTTLESTFSGHKYLSSTERKRLATTLRLSERQVKTWFQNRRAKWRRIKQDPSGQAFKSESEDDNPNEENT